MNKRMNLIKVMFMICLATAVMMPGAFCMSANVPKDDGEAILDSLIRHEEYKRVAMSTPIEPMKNIEEIWELEDMRTESENMLVHTMYLDEYELGFDKRSNTFYCTLGIEETEWPQLSLYAAGEENLRVVWVDDYAYDYREDAIRNGYSYQLFAYTDTSYSYFNLVFTGLPIVTLHVGNNEKIGEEYTPARATVFGQGFDAINSAALVHTRGGGFSKPIKKESYRVEFHSGSGNGKDKKSKVSILGMEEDTDWLLLANAVDDKTVGNYLAFEIWKNWNPDHAVARLDSQMVELFVDDDYKGLYQIMQRVSPQREIVKAGGNLDTDCVIKVVSVRNPSEKPIMNLKDKLDFCIEYQYEPNGDAERAFEHFQEYTILNQPKTQQPDDELFARLAKKHLDVEDLLSFNLFLQACILSKDNITNNQYIWMFWEDGRYVYRFSPWDMDQGFGGMYMRDGTLAVRIHFLAVASRLLDMNLMDSRKKLHEMWKEKRETVISDEALSDLIMSTEEKLNAAGAYLRESKRWYKDARELNLSEELYFVTCQMKTVEDFIEYYWPISENKKIEN